MSDDRFDELTQELEDLENELISLEAEHKEHMEYFYNTRRNILDAKKFIKKEQKKLAKEVFLSFKS